MEPVRRIKLRPTDYETVALSLCYTGRDPHIRFELIPKLYKGLMLTIDTSGEYILRGVDENRTRIICLEDRSFTTKLLPHIRVMVLITSR